MSKAPLSAATTEQKLEKVTLLKKHTHAGVDHEVGATIDVTAPEKAWLVEQQIIAAPAVN